MTSALSPSDDENEKSHTFRQRRLSLSQLLSTNGLLSLDDNCIQDLDDADGITTAVAAVAAAISNTAAEDKGYSFRKRRLSLIQRSTSDSSVASGRTPRRCRRSSETSTTSWGSSNQCYSNQKHTLLTPKVVHAEELFGPHVPLPSPAVSSNNVLYRQKLLPPLPSLLVLPATAPSLSPTISVQQPKWKQRHTVSDENKLPFPKDIVGTYSCHGMEPIYDLGQQQGEGGWLDNEEQEEGAPVEHATFFGAVKNFDEDSASKDEQDHDANDAPPSVVPIMTNSTSTDTGVSKDYQVDAENEVADDRSSDSAIVQAEVVVTTLAADGNDKESDDQPKLVAKINQDRGGIVYPYGHCSKTALFAVYDGHGQGGELVSQYALTEIQRRLEKHKNFRKDLHAAFIDTFLNVDEALKKEPLIEPSYAGTTACVALLQGHEMTIANVGDSRAVMARRNHKTNIKNDWLAIPLTEDQNPDLPLEAERIINAGGFVTASPAPGLSARVWLDPACTEIGLAMSRSIGDHAVAEIGVTAEPVVTDYTIDGLDDFMILASDGVWEFISSNEAVQIVGENLNRGATKACQALIEAAAAKWHDEEGDYRDDITAIVVKLQELWKSTTVSVKK